MTKRSKLIALAANAPVQSWIAVGACVLMQMVTVAKVLAPDDDHTVAWCAGNALLGGILLLLAFDWALSVDDAPRSGDAGSHD